MPYKMDEKTQRLLMKIIFDWSCVSFVALPILLYKLHGVPYKRGFFCNDESISHPYKEGTVSSFALYSIGYGLPILVILLTEYILLIQWNLKRNIKNLLAGWNIICPWVWQCHKVICPYIFGAVCSHLITDIAKYEIGRLRPHFMDVCRPNINCSQLINQHRYIEQYQCTGDDEYKLREMSLSFMSGHSSSSAFNMIFLGMYIYARWTCQTLKLYRHLVQFLAFVLAWYTALSRVSDYKHHWSDVLAGSLQGTLMAVLTALYVCELFPKVTNNSASPTEESNPILKTSVRFSQESTRNTSFNPKTDMKDICCDEESSCE